MRRRSQALAFLIIASVAAPLPGTGTFARTKRAPVVQPPPPPPPPAPADPVGLPDAMIQDAAAFDGYMRRAAAISPAFTDASSVARSLEQARAYAPKTLVRGAVAYGAIAALQSPTFVAALRDAGNSPEHRDQMVDYILANPAYVLVFKGADEAAGRIRQALAKPALSLFGTGRLVRQAAYDIQKQGWSKAEVSDLPGRLAASEAAAAGQMVADPDRVNEVKMSLTATPAAAVEPTSLAPPYPLLISRALQLAAIAALGEANDRNLARISGLAADDDTEACLAAAKRNFHQCLAVAKPNYEDIFCTGQHALLDTGACLVRSVGVETPPEPAPPPPPLVKTKARAHARRKHTTG